MPKIRIICAIPLLLPRLQQHKGEGTAHGQQNFDLGRGVDPLSNAAEAIEDKGNIGLSDETIREIGRACVNALAYRAQIRKGVKNEHV